jgi:quercetin dioxygenase-like cupin family protein
METLISDSKVHAPSDSIISELGLAYLIKTIRKSKPWTNGELNSLILLNKPEKKVILTSVYEGTEIESFQANDSITLQIIEGHIRFRVRNNTVTIREGQVMKLDEHIKYNFVAREDTVFLLTIFNGVGIDSNN